MKMNYVVLGTNNLDAANEFYDELFGQVAVDRMFSNERMTYWQGEDFTFAAALPFDQNVASNGNGTMVGFKVNSIEDVQRLHQKVIELGGTCEGKPNLRGPMFSAYARDLDKNKISFYTDGTSGPDSQSA